MTSLTRLPSVNQCDIISFFTNPKNGEYSATDLAKISRVNRQFKQFVANLGTPIELQEAQLYFLDDKYEGKSGSSPLTNAILEKFTPEIGQDIRGMFSLGLRPCRWTGAPLDELDEPFIEACKNPTIPTDIVEHMLNGLYIHDPAPYRFIRTILNSIQYQTPSLKKRSAEILSLLQKHDDTWLEEHKDWPSVKNEYTCRKIKTVCSKLPCTLL